MSKCTCNFFMRNMFKTHLIKDACAPKSQNAMQSDLYFLEVGCAVVVLDELFDLQFGLGCNKN